MARLEGTGHVISGQAWPPEGEITMNPCSRAHVGENRRGETYRLEQNNGKIRGLMRRVVRDIDSEQRDRASEERVRRKAEYRSSPAGRDGGTHL